MKVHQFTAASDLLAIIPVLLLAASSRPAERASSVIYYSQDFESLNLSALDGQGGWGSIVQAPTTIALQIMFAHSCTNAVTFREDHGALQTAGSF